MTPPLPLQTKVDFTTTSLPLQPKVGVITTSLLNSEQAFLTSYLKEKVKIRYPTPIDLNSSTVVSVLK